MIQFNEGYAYVYNEALAGDDHTDVFYINKDGERIW